MTYQPRVLVATQDPGIASSMVAWLGAAGFDLTIVTTFEAAKAQLAFKPALVIADVKLGAYNGLQVAARAHMLGVAAIVTGPCDAVLRRDASQLGAVYLDSSVHESPLVATAKRLLGLETEPCPAAGRAHEPPADPIDETGDWPPLWRESEQAAPGAQPKRQVVH